MYVCLAKDTTKMYDFMSIRICTVCMYVYTMYVHHAYKTMRMYTLSSCQYVCTSYVSMYVCMYKCMYTYIHIYIYIYMYYVHHA